MIPLRGWIVPALVVCFLLSIGGARGQENHGHTHAGAVGQFYQTWMRPDNRAMSCCHDKDCAPAQSKRIKDSWFARNSDAEDWVEIPASRVEKERDSPDGQSHLCKAGTPGNIFVYCFLPAGSS
jgi:hypothetical protein